MRNPNAEKYLDANAKAAELSNAYNDVDDAIRDLEKKASRLKGLADALIDADDELGVLTEEQKDNVISFAASGRSIAILTEAANEMLWSLLRR